MKLAAAAILIAILVVMVLWASSPRTWAGRVQPFAVYQTTGYTGPGCYADDLTLTVRAQGWLSAGETFRYTTPNDVCSSKIVRGLATAAKRDDARLVVTDWYGDTHFGRRQALKRETGWAACNTDSKSDVQVMLEDERQAPVSWELTALTSGTYRLEMALTEPWWESESGYGYCGHTP